MKRSLFIAALLLFSLAASAQTTWKPTAGSLTCSGVGTPSGAVADVLACANAAADGDTIFVPAGGFAWGSAITGLCKSLTFQAAGADRTVVTATANNTLINVSKSGVSFSACPSKTIRMTGMKVIGPFGSSGAFDFNCLQCTVRVDHIKGVGAIGGTNGTNRLLHTRYWNFTGLADHIILQDLGLGYTEGLDPSDGTTSQSGKTSWASASTAGTATGMVFEAFTAKDLNSVRESDCANGGRRTVRYGYFYVSGPNAGNLGPFNHGYDSVPYACFEALDYHLYCDPQNSGMSSCIEFRGGSGIVHDILAPGSWSYSPIDFANYRSTAGCIGQAGCSLGGQTLCAGYSGVDGNTAGSDPNTGLAYNGYPCNMQVGRGVMTVPEPWGSSSPIYAWKNCKAASCAAGDANALDPVPAAHFTGTNYTANHIAANRDYYSWVSGFDGTLGVGSGSTAARPATCTKGVAYWNTTTSALDKCSATNTWTAGAYADLAYPHPNDNGPWVEVEPVDTVHPNGTAYWPGEAMDYPNQSTAAASATKSVTIQNWNAQTDASDGSVTISSIAVGTGHYALASGGTCSAAPFTLAAGSSCTQNVVFQPSTIGLKADTLTVSFTGAPAGSSATLALSGTGETGGATPPTCTLTASASAGRLGDTYTLTLVTANTPTSALGDQGTGTWNVAGEVRTITPVALGSVTTTITVANSGGSNSCSATYRVDPRAAAIAW
ncbi:MAG: hypothetical protein ACRD3E_09380 [Terriglobales bacterium]